MSRSILEMIRDAFTPRRRFQNVPFRGNAHMMRDIGGLPEETSRVDFTHSLPPR